MKMPRSLLVLVVVLLSDCGLLAADQGSSAPVSTSQQTVAPVPRLVTIPVDSPAIVYSPGNWVGDSNQGGGVFRQTWNSGAYFRLS